MPTATTTLATKTATSTNSIPLKASQPLLSSSPSITATTTTLRPLYDRAARAFLHRDVTETHSLLTSAFSIIPLPQSPDLLAAHRRKWDILRITFETTMYHSPPQSKEVEATIPLALRDILLSSPQALVNSLHQRSLALFTPASHSQKPSSAFLPFQVLITLVLSSMKLECPDVGRGMIEDWLAKWGQFSEYNSDIEGYEKVLDIYCLHVLPRLEEWDYAKEFLQYESELPHGNRNRLASSLQSLHTETMIARRPRSPPRTPTPPPASDISASPRSVSPAPSASSSSSSSSSLSTASTHTAVPRTPRPHALTTHALSRLTYSPSSTSVASDMTVTPTRRSPRSHSHSRSHSRHPNDSNSKNTHRMNGSATNSSVLRPPRTHPSEPAAAATARAPSLLAVVKASLEPYLTTSRMTTLLFVFVLLPLVSLLLRVRRYRRRQALAGGRGVGFGIGGVGSIAAAETVRRRLGSGAGRNMIGWVWGEVVRVIGDTFRMGGGGLG